MTEYPLPYTFDGPVHSKEYDMENAIMRLSNYSQLGYPRKPIPEFVHPEHTVLFVNDLGIPTTKPYPQMFYSVNDYPDAGRRSYCKCRGIHEVAFDGKRMLCSACGKLVRRGKCK